MFWKPKAQGQARGSAWKWPQEVTVSQEHPHPGRLTHLDAGRLAGRASGVQLWLGPGERWGALVSCGQDPQNPWSLGLPEAEGQGISYAGGPKVGRP